MNQSIDKSSEKNLESAPEWAAIELSKVDTGTKQLLRYLQEHHIDVELLQADKEFGIDLEFTDWCLKMANNFSVLEAMVNTFPSNTIETLEKEIASKEYRNYLARCISRWSSVTRDSFVLIDHPYGSFQPTPCFGKVFKIIHRAQTEQDTSYREGSTYAQTLISHGYSIEKLKSLKFTNELDRDIAAHMIQLDLLNTIASSKKNGTPIATLVQTLADIEKIDVWEWIQRTPELPQSSLDRTGDVCPSALLAFNRLLQNANFERHHPPRTEMSQGLWGREVPVGLGYTVGGNNFTAPFSVALCRHLGGNEVAIAATQTDGYKNLHFNDAQKLSSQLLEVSEEDLRSDENQEKLGQYCVLIAYRFKQKETLGSGSLSSLAKDLRKLRTRNISTSD